jgi:hypothetical protein
VKLLENTVCEDSILFPLEIKINNHINNTHYGKIFNYLRT